ncbi:helix-turn-helix transcriptional regulator [Agrobacterium tumefaciens]|uniref:hypothetical protein n=1 Tax=Agrobacterium tumefaciens TaxID=358 RepID=UPI00129A1B5B|nr:hypothetical protein [Agrobacterium tumefaciens]MRH98870.1 hypothetical protein [Agrobacterium tumefaciens]
MLDLLPTITSTSDRDQRHRLLGILIALADRGYIFKKRAITTVADQLSALLRGDQSYHWTTAKTGQALGKSEATLRRRLSEEHLRFEDILVDVRMHHAMILLQTTTISISDIGNTCYQTRARFSERFEPNSAACLHECDSLGPTFLIQVVNTHERSNKNRAER